jgi:hypothetical protein
LSNGISISKTKSLPDGRKVSFFRAIKLLE